jgi:hypothetical protein
VLYHTAFAFIHNSSASKVKNGLGYRDTVSDVAYEYFSKPHCSVNIVRSY